MRQQPVDDRGRIVVEFACPFDGEALRRQSVESACPKCGRPIAQLLATVAGRFDGDGRLKADVPCARCGYNLRSQPVNGRCTECGAANSRSAFILYLGDAPASWLWRLRLGVDLILLAVIVAAAFPLLFSTIWALQSFGVGPRSYPDVSETFVRGYYAVALSIAVLGVFLTTLRDPTLLPGCQRRSRALTRLAAATVYLTLIALIVFDDQFHDSLLRAILIVCCVAAVRVSWRIVPESSPFLRVIKLLIACAIPTLGGLVWYAWVEPLFSDYLRIHFANNEEDWYVLCLASLGACALFCGARFLAHLLRRAERRTLASAMFWLGAAAGGVLLISVIWQIVLMRFVWQTVSVTTSMPTSGAAFAMPPPTWMSIFSLVAQILQWIAVALLLIAVMLLPRTRMALSAALRQAREAPNASGPADKSASSR